MGSTILLADKSITIQKIVELTFADDAYVIKCFSDGEAALAAVPQLRPDLILADISLPLKSGYDLCQTVRNDPQYSDFSAVPVVLLAGIYETMDDERARAVEERAQQVGANEVLSKPFDPQVLTTKVKEYLQHAQIEEVSSTEAPTVIEQVPKTVSQNLFTESFELPSVASLSYQEAPEDDSERTMMLPRSAVPDSNLFAGPAALNEPVVKQESRSPVDIGSISPANEPVFDEDEEFAESNEEAEGHYAEVPTESGIPYVEAMIAEEAPMIILPTAEEPFGDVFEEQAPPSQWSAPASTEEESPFGVPEPLVAPAVAEVEAEAEAPAMEPLTEEPELQQQEFVSIDDHSTPEPAAEELQAPATGEETSAATGEDSYDDTWPGVILSSGQPVEELFEPENAPVVPETNLMEKEPSAQAHAAPLEATHPAQTGGNSGPLQITDDLVDKIAERVVTKLSERLVSEIVWQVVPDLAEKMIRRELEKLHASEE